MSKYHLDYHYSGQPEYYGDTLFIQLGRLYCVPSTHIQKHAHADIFELTIVTGGEGTVITNDVPIAVSKGDIYLSFPGDFHEICTSQQNPLKYDFFAFNTKNTLLKSEFKKIMNTVRSYEGRVFRDETVNATVSVALAEMTSKQEYHDKVITLLFEQILYYIVRNFRTDKIKLKSKYTVSADELCYQIMNYIDTHIYSIDNLSVLSDRLNYNYSYLSDLFKKTTGNTIAEYYYNRRLDTAALLIKEGKLRISQISEMLKYATPYSFSKAFKKKYGVSPKKYNKKVSD